MEIEEMEEEHTVMSEEQENTLKLAMFPLMLQALYNAQFYINKKVEGSDWKFVENTEHNQVGEAFRQMEDLRMILRAFRDVGINPRCPMEEVKNEFSGVGLYKMRHFSELEKDHVQKLFDPSIRDYKDSVERYREDVQKVLDEKDSQIKELTKEVHKWKSIAGGEKGELRRDFCIKHNERLVDAVVSLGTEELGKAVSGLPNCTTIEEFRMDASMIRSKLLPKLSNLQGLNRKYRMMLANEVFDVLTEDGKQSA